MLNIFQLPRGLSAVSLCAGPKLCSCVPYLSTMKAEETASANGPQRGTARHTDLSCIVRSLDPALDSPVL